jgi:hypothetical protein
MIEQALAPFTDYQVSSEQDRRKKPRMSCSYPALVRGHLQAGARIERRAVLANLSANGMYLRMKSAASLGETLLVIVRMSTAPLNQSKELRLAAFGKVVRLEPKADGTYGVALKLHRHRFL